MRARIDGLHKWAYDARSWPLLSSGLAFPTIAYRKNLVPLSPRTRFRVAMILAMAADALQIFGFPLFAEGFGDSPESIEG